MVRTDIYEARSSSEQLGWTRIATITADGQALSTEGDERRLRIILGLTVLDPDKHGHLLSSHEDPETWTRALPGLLRGPVVIATSCEAPAR